MNPKSERSARHRGCVLLGGVSMYRLLVKVQRVVGPSGRRHVGQNAHRCIMFIPGRLPLDSLKFRGTMDL